MQTTTTTKAVLNNWTDRAGRVRRYVNNWANLVGLEITRYKTGNIRFASIGDESISNAAAGRLIGVKVWLDEGGAVHVDHWQDGTERYAITPDAIRSAVEAAL